MPCERLGNAEEWRQIPKAWPTHLLPYLQIGYSEAILGLCRVLRSFAKAFWAWISPLIPLTFPCTFACLMHKHRPCAHLICNCSSVAAATEHTLLAVFHYLQSCVPLECRMHAFEQSTRWNSTELWSTCLAADYTRNVQCMLILLKAVSNLVRMVIEESNLQILNPR